MNRVEAVLFFLIVGAAFLALIPAESFAQSGIAGTVRDSSGAVLPGVVVRAESPVLIEKVREVVTDGGGEYKIVDLRPGTYSMTFTLTGFTTLHREGIDLPTNFVAAIDVAMSVGSTEQTVEVTGSEPLIDTQNVVQQEVLSRQELDDIPTPRNIQAVATTALGVKNSRPDVGGSEGMQLTANTEFGSETRDVTLEIDGMPVTTSLADGSNFAVYHNDGEFVEVTDQTAGMPADVKTGGLLTNMIPKEGGNQLHGSIFAAYAPGSLQSTNLDAALITRGLTVGPNIAKIWDYNGGIGGPILKDRLWFYSSMRYWGVNQYPTGSSELTPDPLYPLGAAGLDDSLLQSYSLRLTGQVTSKNKVTAAFDWDPKYRGHRNVGAGVEPRASVVQRTPSSWVGTAKWTSTLSSKLLVEAGVSIIRYNYTLYPQPEVKPTDISQMDLTTGTVTNAATNYIHNWFSMYRFAGSVSYVTGSHAFKFGYEEGFGTFEGDTYVNGDMVEIFNAGKPFQVAEANTPQHQSAYIHADNGLYALDQWKLKRVTLTYGVRFDYFNAGINAQSAPAGTFVGARSFPAIPNLPNWADFSPRLGFAYDVFGNGRTAIVKLGFNKYVRNEATGFAMNYNPMALAPTSGAGSDVRTWVSPPAGCVIGAASACVATPSQLGPDQNLSFGAPTNRIDGGVTRPYQLEWTADVQHQFSRGWAVDVGYFRRGFHKLITTLTACNPGVTVNGQDCSNQLLVPADYTALNFVSPLDGSNIPVYSLNSALTGKTHSVDLTSASDRRVYNGFSVGVHGKFRHGIVFGGVETGRSVAIECQQTDPNLFRFCDQSLLGIPFSTQYKLGGTYNFPWGVQLGGFFQSNAGDAHNSTFDKGPMQDYEDPSLQENFTVSKTNVPGLTQSSVSVPLIPPGTNYLPRLSQTDLRVAKIFHISERISVEGMFDVFNVFNANTVFTATQTFGGSYLKPTGVVQPRVFRFGGQLKF